MIHVNLPRTVGSVPNAPPPSKLHTLSLAWCSSCWGYRTVSVHGAARPRRCDNLSSHSLYDSFCFRKQLEQRTRSRWGENSSTAGAVWNRWQLSHDSRQEASLRAAPDKPAQITSCRNCGHHSQYCNTSSAILRRLSACCWGGGRHGPVFEGGVPRWTDDIMWPEDAPRT